ncbi:MAG: sodium:proton antiporter NhaD [Prevotella sp.]
MTSLTLAIVFAFIVGYFFIAIESFTKVNKAAIALLTLVVCWTLFMFGAGDYLPGLSGDDLYNQASSAIEKHLGSTSTTLFFLMGAMTIVEIVDQNGGFDFVRKALHTTSERKLLWQIAFMTFFLSAILDNMTTAIVMIMILRKLVSKHEDRIIFASLVIIAANTGGAFSPIGDVTTIMLWNKGVITPLGVISEVFVPSVVSLVVPVLIMQYSLKGRLVTSDSNLKIDSHVFEFDDFQRKVIFFLGVGGLIFVPIFKSITHLPPFVGILLVLAILWITSEIFYRKHHHTNAGMNNRVSNLLSKIDLSTILFFLGILMAVSCLEQVGVLQTLGTWLNQVSNGNHYIVTGVIGLVSSVVDNVPLVAGCMGMYPIQAVGDMAVDGIFWQLLAYCAGVGGSILIIGSAAGVVVMGLEKITFGWYMKHVSWLALVGYLSGILSYWLIRAFLFTASL